MIFLKVKDLKTYFFTNYGVVKAVDGVDLEIEDEKTVGIVGESGCGKSITALSILGLLGKNNGRIIDGQILYSYKNEIIDLAKLDPYGKIMRSIRGKEISMIFQDPMASMNPVYTIGYQISEAISLHYKLSKADIKNKTIEMLKSVGVPSPETRLNDYPHQLSGGMQQRAMIAMSLSCNPSILIADEPTTSLDVTIEAQVLELMNNLKQKFKTSILFISHDLAVIARMADSVIIMYLGKIVESANTYEIFNNPKHPYTIALLNSLPAIEDQDKDFLKPIEGSIPDPYDIISGCKFESRCAHRMDICKKLSPPLKDTNNNHKVACWLLDI